MAASDLPNLVVIGAMKAGTTSLHNYLDQHPDIQMSEAKELDFFITEGNWGRGLDWYRSWFNPESRIRGETSPSYSFYPKRMGVPERMSAVLPDARLIYLLRDPIERMLSHYSHSVWNGREARRPDEALTDTSSLYFIRSRYATQLEQYDPYYPRESMLVVTTEELRRDRVATLASIFRFLDVDDGFRSDSFADVHHVSSGKRKPTAAGAALVKIYRAVKPFIPRSALEQKLKARARQRLLKRIEPPVLSPAARARVAANLADEMARLRARTGRTFDEWSI